MHIYFIRNRGEIMKQNKKIAITHYISIRFSAIIFIMAAIMILFISYFSNKTIYFDIRRQIRKETHYDFLNIDIVAFSKSKMFFRLLLYLRSPILKKRYNNK